MLPEFLARLRNRLLADPRFIAFAQRFPPARLAARRSSSQLFDIIAGFAYAQVLSACVTLRVFDTVGQAGCRLAALAAATGLPVERCALLVKAAAALDLLEQRGERVILGRHGAALLAQPWIMGFVEHHSHFYRDLEDPVALLRSGQAAGGLSGYWAYGQARSDAARYSALMAESQRAVSEQILAGYDFRRHRRLLDVGGGTGAFLRTAGVRHPHLELHLFDLPRVVALAESDPGPAIHPHGGDFRCDPLPSGMDVISLVRVVHDHDDDTVAALFSSIRAAAAPGATLLVAEPLSGNRATARATDAYFNLYFAAMGQGRTRTPAEIATLAGPAGWGALRLWSTPIPLIAGVMSLTATVGKT